MNYSISYDEELVDSEYFPPYSQILLTHFWYLLMFDSYILKTLRYSKFYVDRT